MDKQQALNEQIAQAENAYWGWQYSRTIALCEPILTAIPANHPDKAQQSIRFRALDYLASAKAELGFPQEALTLYQKYQAESADSPAHHLQAVCHLAGLFMKMGQINQASDYLDEAIALAPTVEDKSLYGLIAYQQANLAWHQGHLEEVINLYHRALRLYEQVGDLQEQMNLWANIGFTHHYRGQIDKAIKGYEASLDLARQLNSPTIGMMLSNIGECYQDLFDIETAYQYHQEALTASEKLPPETDGFYSTLADLERNLGVDLYYLGQTDEAATILETALDLLDNKQDDREIRLQTLYTLALIDLQRGNLDKAKEYIDQLRGIATAHEQRVHLSRSCHLLGLYHQAQGDLATAQAAWEEGQFLAHETGQRIELIWIHAAQGATAVSPQLARTHYQIAASLIQQVVAPIEDTLLANTFLNAPQIKNILDLANN